MSKELNFKTMDSLKNVTNVINEANVALNDSSRTIAKSAIPEVLTGALGAGAGSAISFAALYGLGTVGLSAAGITSGLAAAGAIVGGGMAAGVGVLALPVAALAATGVGITAAVKRKKLLQEKQRLYNEAIRKQNAIIEELNRTVKYNKKRIDYLTSINIVLQKAIRDLKADIDAA